jgi:hypothetical protein
MHQPANRQGNNQAIKRVAQHVAHGGGPHHWQIEIRARADAIKGHCIGKAIGAARQLDGLALGNVEQARHAHR